MIDMRKSVYDAIHTVTMEDPLYDCLPRLVDGEQDVIYTIQRIQGLIPRLLIGKQ